MTLLLLGKEWGLMFYERLSYISRGSWSKEGVFGKSDITLRSGIKS